MGPRFFSHFGRRLVEIAQIPAGTQVLDVATGRGAVLYPACEAVHPNGHVVGIDLSENMLRETTQEITRRNISPGLVEVCQMDAEHIQFHDNSFDFVLSGFALFFFPQIDLAMSEFYRVLKPHGRICVSTFERLFDENWTWFFEIAKTYLTHESAAEQIIQSRSASRSVFDTPAELETVLNAAGFRDIQVFSEAAEFIYTSEEEFWSTLWSYGPRATLEKIEQVAGADGLQKFKSEIFKKISSMKQTDGLHHSIPVLMALATKLAL